MFEHRPEDRRQLGYRRQPQRAFGTDVGEADATQQPQQPAAEVGIDTGGGHRLLDGGRRQRPLPMRWIDDGDRAQVVVLDHEPTARTQGAGQLARDDFVLGEVLPARGGHGSGRSRRRADRRRRCDDEPRGFPWASIKWSQRVSISVATTEPAGTDAPDQPGGHRTWTPAPISRQRHPSPTPISSRRRSVNGSHRSLLACSRFSSAWLEVSLADTTSPGQGGVWTRPPTPRSGDKGCARS